MNPPPEVVQTAKKWDSLSRWERAELGRLLRRAGWTYGEIMDLLPVPKGTLAGWCKEIRLTEDQIEAIKARRPPGIRSGIPVDTQRKRRAEIVAIRNRAALEAKEMLHDSFWMAGLVMYWAEGTKARRRLELTNSDERALQLFIAWTRRYHRPDAEFVLELHLHQGNDDTLARAHWASTLGLIDPRFYPTFIKPAGTGHRKNKLKHGVCRVSMTKSTDAFHRTMAWIDEVADFQGAFRR
jgi:hypothetical protein